MDAINDIAERATYDRPIRNRFYTALCAKHHDQEPGTNDKRKKQEAPPGGATQKPEGYAIIAMEREIKPGKDSDPVF
ncbi:hypothetical protein MACH18_35560 [Phaeobacter italicus]|jgi:hypothetical protein|nr:hypothetical protein MACH18_35560 [Phaeobacter italicus]